MQPAATSFLAARHPHPPSPEMAQPGEGQAQARPWTGRLALLLVCLAGGAVGWALHRAGYDPGFVVAATYPLVLLCFCLWKYDHVRRNPGDDPAAAARQRRRIGHAALVLSLGQVSMAALYGSSAAHSQGLKDALRGLAGMAMGLSFYYLFVLLCRDNAARSPEKDLHQVSPEQRV